MRARLTVEDGDAFPREWPLQGQDLVRLGRNKANDIIVRNEHASRFHAEIYAENGRWWLRDCDTVNGTFHNGTRITEPTLLEHGCEIRITNVSLRFGLALSERPTQAGEPARKPAIQSEDDSLNLSTAILRPDELTALLIFMDSSLRETTSAGVVNLALRTVHHQMQAAVSGFLSLDEDDPLPKMVLPALSKVDIHLSRELTLRVQRDGRTAWLSRDPEGSGQHSDSLVSFQDALCVPVQNGAAPLGALHVYRGASAFEPREVRFCEALASCLARCLYLLRSRRALEADNSRLRVHASATEPELVGESPPMKQLKQKICKLAERPRIILVSGESGSGKELVALALHKLSSRKEGPLVPVNCASIPATMAEAELFGHKQGSFTGADCDRPGFFQQADMGTLFLDEIGELPLEFQPKLLRVLDSWSFRAVGGTEDIKADVRIVAATNRDLKREVAEGRFRQDLYFRLDFEIKVPPLRERRGDISLLAEHFLAHLTAEYRRPVRLSPQALERLREYHWPGNVRQLRSALEYAVAMGEGPVIGADELRLVSEDPLPAAEELSLDLEKLEQWAIRQALARTHGTIVQAARLLGIHRDTLMAKMKKYKIENPRLVDL